MRYVLFIILVLIIGCNHNQIEIIPDYDTEYIDFQITESKPEIISGEIKPILEEKTIQKLNKNLPKLDKDYFVDLSTTLYINENGKIDAIKFEDNFENKSNYHLATKSTLDLIKKELTINLAKLEIKPATKDQKKVKVRWTTIIPLILGKDGHISPWVKPVSFNELDPPKEFSPEKFYTAVEVMPSPIGGTNAIAEKVKYPIEAKENGVQGRVFLKAFIDENGNVVYVELLKSVGSGCDEAALDAVVKTKFSPGFQNGKAVKTQVTIPIMFSLK